MKIIKPLSLARSQTASTAQAENLPLWEVEGRDLLGQYDTLALDAEGGELWAMGPADGQTGGSDLHRFTLSTGDSQSVPARPSDAPGTGVMVSPNGLWVAVSYNVWQGNESGTGVYVFEISTGNQLYYRAADRAYLQGWSDDSSALVFSTNENFNSQLVAAQSSNWSTVTGPLHTSGFFPGHFGVSGSTHYFMHSSYNGSQDANANYDHRYKTFNALTGAETDKGGYTGSASGHGPEVSVFIPARNQFLAYMRDTGLLESFDLNLNKVDGGPSGVSTLGVSSLTLSGDGNSVIVEVSAKPYYRRFDSTTYAFIENLPAVYEDIAGRIFYDGDYAIGVAREGGGYVLIDTTTDTLISEVNPSVSEGDVYRYVDRRYEVLTDNQDRPDVGAEANPPTWLDKGLVNPYRMFDGKLDSQTTAPEVLTIEVTPGVIANGLALLNIQARTVQVTMDDPTDGQVYDSGEITMLDNSGVGDWWSHFYAPYLPKADLALIDLPPYPDATITVVVDNQGGTAQVGELVVGRIQSLGETQYGTSVGIIDSSKKERDVFGNFEIVERNFSKRAEYDVTLSTGAVSGVQRILAGYRAAPVVWIGAVEQEATIVYGFYRDFQLNYSTYSLSDATITVEGL